MESTKFHILIIRTSSLIIDFRTYNCQEIGLAAALVKKGYKVSFITPGKMHEHIHLPVNGDEYIDVYTLTFSKLNRNICWYHGFLALLKKINPDLLHINSISLSMSFVSQLWAEHHKKATVIIQGNYDITHKPILSTLETIFNKTFGRYLINHAGAIGCKTDWAANFIHKYSSQVTTYLTRIGLDLSPFTNSIDIDWLKRLHIEKKKILLYVGALEQRRNPTFLLNLVSILPDNYILLIAGEGSMFAEMKDLCKTLDIEKRCYFLGKLQQQELPSLYKVSDLFLLPSSYEIFGMVILESMYFGTPVISTLTAGADAIITNDKDGVIIDGLNPKLWRSAILNIVENNNVISLMKSNAHHTIETELTWDKASEKFILLYEKAFQKLHK